MNPCLIFFFFVLTSDEIMTLCLILVYEWQKRHILNRWCFADTLEVQQCWHSVRRKGGSIPGRQCWITHAIMQPLVVANIKFVEIVVGSFVDDLHQVQNNRSDYQARIGFLP
jgi:hypothetical protein